MKYRVVSLIAIKQQFFLFSFNSCNDEVYEWEEEGEACAASKASERCWISRRLYDNDTLESKFCVIKIISFWEFLFSLRKIFFIVGKHVSLLSKSFCDSEVWMDFESRKLVN